MVRFPASTGLRILVAAALCSWVAPVAARAQQAGCGPCPPPPTSPPSVAYRLGEPSNFTYGCFEPCLCPIFSRSGMIGTFSLTPTFFDGLYQHYSLCDISWTIIPSSGPPQVVHGTGRYRVGGEVALQHELDLCVSFNGGPIQTFRSGLIQGGGGFPKIDIETALHGFFCFDSALAVHAAPTTADIDEAALSFDLRAAPNPTQGFVDLSFALPRPGRSSLVLVDAQGRSVRIIDRGSWKTAGEHRVRWDGLREDGSPAPAGVYFARLRVEGREVTGSFVKL